jgi:hypothetical protein
MAHRWHQNSQDLVFGLAEVFPGMHRLNHMAMTVPKDSITPQWVADMKAFYGEIFGWDVAVVREGKSPDSPLHHIYMELDPHGQQYLYIAESDHPMYGGGMEHLGIIVQSREEVESLLKKCIEFEKTDHRVDLGNSATETPRLEPYDPENADGSVTGAHLFWDNGWLPPYVVYAFNVSYLIPVGWDVMFEDYKPGRVPPKIWQFAGVS